MSRTIYSTAYQCFNFLARTKGVISFAPKPDDPCTNRCVVRVGEGDGEITAAVEYDCTEPRDLIRELLAPVCSCLQAQLEEKDERLSS